MKKQQRVGYAVSLGLALIVLAGLIVHPNAQQARGVPQIVSVQFPNVIPPDGGAVEGVVEFIDNDHDTQTLELSVVRAFDFSGLSVPVEIEVQTPGITAFALSSHIIQPVALEARLVDAQGHKSAPVLFHFAAVTPEREVAPGVYFINAWGQRGAGPGQFDFEGPQGLRVGPDGNVYVIDEGGHRIQVFDPQGQYLREWGGLSPRGQPGKFNFPSDLVFAQNGNIYVSDSLNHRIQVFDPDLNYLFEWGEKGSQDGQFLAPRGLAINGHNEIFVADEQNGRIQVFDLQGRFLRKWGRLGKDGPGEFNVIVGLDVDEEDNVYVADGFNHRIQVFDAQGNFLRMWGEHGKGDGQFDDPVGVAVAPEGWVGITDSFSDRVQIWTSQGAFLRAWGSQTDVPGTGFKLPLGAASDGLGMLYIGDHFNRRAQSFYIAITSQQIAEANAALHTANE